MEIHVYLYHSRKDAWERLVLDREDAIFSVGDGTIRAGQLCGRSHSALIWSDERAIRALETLRYVTPVPLRIAYAFRRLYEGAHRGQSAHCAGLAFDLDWPEFPKYREEVARLALRSGFSYVEPGYLSPTWLHVELRLEQTSCLSGKYPALQKGMNGVHAMVAQEALVLAGCYHDALTGVFSDEMERAVRRFQSRQDILVSGRIDHRTWVRLIKEAEQNKMRAEEKGISYAQSSSLNRLEWYQITPSSSSSFLFSPE